MSCAAPKAHLSRLTRLAIVGLVVASCAAQNPADLASDRTVAAAASDWRITYSEPRAPCTDRNRTRNAYFGDLHIHTAFSYDARPIGTETTPEDAYRFARGGPIPIPPYDDQGNPAGFQRLSVPLDFAAVTDHSEFFGDMKLCFDPVSPVYDEPVCHLFRVGEATGMRPFARIVNMPEPSRMVEICGKEGKGCNAAGRELWRQTVEMADAAYDRTSACTFTSFVAYEYTGTPNANNLHRNVIFRNSQVPVQPISYIETPSDQGLWQQLSERCLKETDGCDVLAIPHNSNLSAGAMFPSYVGNFESVETARDKARLRNAMEPVMEVFQHKGNSECFNGFPDILGAPDELCETEQVLKLGRENPTGRGAPVVDFCEDQEIGQRGFMRVGCISKNDFYRSVLLTGMQDEAVIGINSYKLGVIASTDTHMSLSGDTAEASWSGHLAPEVALTDRLTQVDFFVRSLDANPGGLAGVWAVENSRDAIFDALRRREVFGTTGSRIRPRLFGGWDFDEGSCERADRSALGYESGVPMGTDLPPGPKGAAPRLLVYGFRDPNSAPLQKLQVIKGWVDREQRSRYAVIDVAGVFAGEGQSGEIDLETGEWRGPGSESLCTVFVDPDFDPALPAYYYLRAVEVPTLRWSWRACVALPESERPDECRNSAPKTLQEMAWTSPIWYLPPTGD